MIKEYKSLITIIPEGAKSTTISLPMSILIYKRATKLEIEGHLIKSMHYIDLQCLILSMEIDNLNQYVRELRRMELNKRGIKEVKKATEQDFDSL